MGTGGGRERSNGSSKPAQTWSLVVAILIPSLQDPLARGIQ